MNGWAFLTVQMPPRVMAEYEPTFPPVRLESSDGVDVWDLRANGRAARVPSGVVRLTAQASGAPPITVTLELGDGESRTYRFTDRQFRVVQPRQLAIAGVGDAFRGASGAFFVRFLEGPRRRPVRATHIVSGTADGGLTVTFEREPGAPLFADVLAPGHSRFLLSLATTELPEGYRMTRLSVDRHAPTATISGDLADPELRAARQFAWGGNLGEAMHLVRPYLDDYRVNEPTNDLEAAAVAYIVIRAGDVNALFPWGLELSRSPRLAADGLVVAAEWFAEAGCHLTALNMLRRMTSMGFPLFTDGYSLAIARLASYATVDIRSRSDLDKDERQSAMMIGQELREWNRLEARAAHKQLTRRIAQVDWSSYWIRAAPRPRLPLPRFLRTTWDRLDTLLTSDWTRIAWQVHESPQTDPNARSTTWQDRKSKSDLKGA